MTVRSRLAAMWSFDTTHGSSLTDEHLGVLTLDGGTAAAVTGKVRQALSLSSASSEYRSRSNDASIQQLKGCCCWVNLTTKSADMVILSKGSSVANDDQSIKLWYDQSDDEFKYTVGDNTTSTTVASTGLTIATGTWYHIRCYNDGARMGIAVNGTTYGTDTARTPLSETGILYIGRDASGSYFNGLIDEVAVFSIAPTASDGAVLYNGGDGLTLPEFDSLPGPSGRAGFSNRWIPPSFAESAERELYLAHGKRRVQRFDGYGTVASAGVPAPETNNTIATSGVGRILGTFYSYVRFLDADGHVSAMSPISDKHEAFGDSIGEITGATNASPIVITSTSHGLSTGNRIQVNGQQGNTAANGIWYITKINDNSFSLDSSQGNGDWTASSPPSLVITERQAGRAAVNAVQSLSFPSTPSGGTFTLTYAGEETGAISATASAATIQTALEGLGTIGSGNVSCSGGALPTEVTVTFQGDLAGVPVETLTADTTNVLGADVTLSVATLTGGNAGTDEVQTLDLYGSPTGGTFTLTLDGQTTGAIAYNASAATVDSALEALSNVGAGNVAVTGSALPSNQLTITFGGSLADTNMPAITADVSSLTGGGISASVAETTPGVEDLGDSLGAYWKFESGATTSYATVGSDDLSGGSWSYVSGKQGNAGYSNGTVRKKNSPGSGVRSTLGTGWSTSMWVYVRGTGNTELAAHKEGDSAMSFPPTSEGWYLWKDGTDSNKLKFSYVPSSGSTVTLTGPAASVSTWYHIVVTKTNSGGLTLYVNGTQQATDTKDFASPATAVNSLRVGDASYYYDEWGIWQRELSLADVTTLYNSGSGQAYPLPSGTNEVQTITVAGSPSAGSFTLTYGGQSATINYDDTAAEIDTALEALSSIGSGNVSCTGGPLPGSTVAVEFTGDLASTDLSLMTVNDDLLQYAIATTADGSPAQSEVQRISAAPTPVSGTWTATFGANTTASLAYDISASALQTALEGLASIGSGNVAVTGGPLATAPFVITFQSSLANTNTAEISTASSVLGAAPAMSITVTTAGLVAQNEIQEISVNSISGGTFTLTYAGETTAAIQSSAVAADVKTALETLSAIDAVAVTGGPLTTTKFNVEFQGSLASTDVALMTADTSALQNGGWSLGANTVTYSDVEVPTDLRVTRRQILRTKPGSAAVVYVDVDTTDVSGTTFTSTNTDDDLTTSVVLRDSNGVDTNLNRHGEPPAWKHVVASFQNRLFLGVDYTEDAGVLHSDGSTVTGIGTDWPTLFDARNTYGEALTSGYVNSSVAAGTQVVTLTGYDDESSETADGYRIREEAPDGQRIYHSWLTAAQNYPESFDVSAPFQVSRDRRDGEMTGQYSFDGRFYVTFENTTYRYAFSSSPAQTPDGDGTMQVAMPRGLLNHNCVTFADDIAYCMDRQGIYRFDGQSIESISDTIKPAFVGRGVTQINWNSARWFHCQYFPETRAVRFFVSLDGNQYPRQALCFNTDHQYWWIEEYPFPITSSTLGAHDGKLTIFLGSTGRQIFTLDGNHEIVDAATSGTLRGTISAVGTDTITDSTAAFTSDLIGSFVRIENSRGNLETREIVGVTATTLTVDVPWFRYPSIADTYQVGGIAWSIKTGVLRYVESNQRSVRKVELVWTPTARESTIRHQVLQDMSESALVSKVTQSAAMSNGVAVTDGSSYRDTVTTRASGHVERAFSDIRQDGVDGKKFVALSFDGITNGEQHRIHSIAVAGSE